MCMEDIRIMRKTYTITNDIGGVTSTPKLLAERAPHRVAIEIGYAESEPGAGQAVLIKFNATSAGATQTGIAIPCNTARKWTIQDDGAAVMGAVYIEGQNNANQTVTLVETFLPED